MSTYSAGGPMLGDCVRMANEALYEGKRAGKNRVVAAPAPGA